jgi:hypothetical protein
MPKVQANLKSLLAGIDVPVANEIVLVVEREPIPLLRLTHENFCFRIDGSVLMPEGAVAGFAALVSAAASEKMAHVAVVGHALDDESVALAKERAENVMAFATARKWVEHAFEHHNLHEVQQILTWAARTRGIDCDPQGIDGDFGSNSRGALERFRMARGVDKLFAGATKPELEDWQAFAALYSEAIAEAAGAALSDWEALRQEWQIRDPKCVAAGTTWTCEDVAMTGYKVVQGSGAVVDCFIFPDYANPWYSGEQGLPAQAIDAEPIFAAKNVDFSTPDQPPDLGKNAAKGAKKKKKKPNKKPGKTPEEIKAEEQAITYARYVEVVDEMNRMLAEPTCWDDAVFLAWAEEREAIWDHYVALGGEEPKLHESVSELPVEPDPDDDEHSTLDLSFGVFFDGTGNNYFFDRQRTADGFEPTNVSKLFKLYEKTQGKSGSVYARGIGTRDVVFEEDDEDKEAQSVSDIFDMGAGGGIDERINQACDELVLFLKEISSEAPIRCFVDVFGFSRGAATARIFMNELNNRLRARSRATFDKIAHRWVDGIDIPLDVTIELRFIGLYDCVGSIGMPGDEDNNGYNLHISPQQANAVYHVASFHEHRQNFPITSIHDEIGAASTETYFEEFLPGVHADIGGGYSDLPEKIFLARSDAEDYRTIDDFRPEFAGREGTLDTEMHVEGHVGLGVDVGVVNWVVWTRPTKKDLSFLTLERMHARALKFDVPFRPLEKLREVSDAKLDFEIQPSLRQTYERALAGDSVAMRELERNYIHHSAQPVAPPEYVSVGEFGDIFSFHRKAVNPNEAEADPKLVAPNGKREIFLNRHKLAVVI